MKTWPERPGACPESTLLLSVINLRILLNNIFAVFNGVMVIVRHDFEIFVGKLILTAKFGDVDSEIVARSGVSAEHLERCSGGTLFDVAMNAKAGTQGVILEDVFEGFWVAMEVGDDWLVWSEDFVELLLGKFALGGADAAIS